MSEPLTNLFTAMLVPQIFLERNDYNLTITLTDDDLPYYIHNRKSDIPGWAKIKETQLYPDSFKMIEYRFLEVFGYAIKKDNSYYIHISADEMLYSPDTGLFYHPENIANFSEYMNNVVLRAYLELNTHSLQKFPDSAALKQLDMDIKDTREHLKNTFLG